MSIRPARLRFPALDVLIWPQTAGVVHVGVWLLAAAKLFHLLKRAPARGAEPN